ncbi:MULTISPECIES: hypothetical protein [Pseudomonas]|uniref:hypothetical protein n=1 Tax=Pseudomonas TaxID=286 RepID=UPI0022DDA41B|nr:hypothetical protein [Pseudomonas sp. NY11382]WBM35262.1 hypothetical protein M2J80_12665 [Pseudomonas sp. NY11382]
MRTFAAFVFSFFFTASCLADDLSKVDFDFNELSTKTALQLIADAAGLNLIGADDIKGSLVMRMKSVTWKEALDYVSKSKGLHYDIENNVLSISSDRDYFVNLDSPLPGSINSPYKVSVLKVRNIPSVDAIKAFPLDQGETLNAEESSSVIVARMSNDRLAEFREYLEAVDYSRKLVLIEARIVEVDRSYTKNLGVRWNTSVGSGAGVVTGIVPLGLTPAAIAGFGITSRSFNLDAELDAMEQAGKGRVISSPRVSTTDRHQAKIINGSQVPYQQSAGDGATSVSFKEAALSLDVRPIVNDEGVLLDVILNKDEPNYAKAINGVPPINTTSLTSRVFSGFGKTVALGGVYSDADSTVVRSVPFFGQIPGLKWLFNSTSTVKTESELILFLTPRLADASYN